ncbi:MAG: hypothetical protein NC347_15540 [Clostridium sp.]|nr:hypothetical protein [Clostridium sp.]
MQIYYDITLKDEANNSSISYWADSFSVDENRILRVESVECGDIAVRIDVNERLIVRDVCVKDEFDEIFSSI